ncbi:MAG: hypothetical protein GY795_40020, partial [Desulfobacterales bacterium]|nr:hypothetical protein [Desulfobacterales bacterium]
MKRNIVFIIGFSFIVLTVCFITITTVQAEDFTLQYEEIFDDPEAQVIVRYGDVDNLGFGWPEGYDPFSGESTPRHYHGWPWEADPDDASGTDRIIVISSYSGYPHEDYDISIDGYTYETSRPENEPCEIKIQFTPPDPPVSSVILQVFVDDFESPVWHSSFQVTMNGIRVQELEDVLNSLRQTGPTGKLITFELPDRVVATMQNNELIIFVDDPVTGAGDGFAFDFFRLLINPGSGNTQPVHTAQFNGHSYELFIDTNITWHQAKAIAEDMGGYLATITSAEEQQFIENLLISSGAPTGAYWFGLVETGTEGIYTWDNGESLSYTNWDNNQPDNYQGADSGQILWTVEPEAHTFNRRGKWDDVLSEGIKESLHYPDLDRRGYIVESQPTECIEDDSGSIDITGKSGPCSGKLTIPVRIQNAPNAANSLGFEVAFDSNVLTYTGFARGPLAEQFDFFNVTEVPGGLVRCGGFKAEELAEGSVGDLLYLQFDVSAECHDSKLELRELKDDISTWTASHGCFSMKCTGDVNSDGEITPKDAL